MLDSPSLVAVRRVNPRTSRTRLSQKKLSCVPLALWRLLGCRKGDRPANYDLSRKVSKMEIRLGPDTRSWPLVWQWAHIHGWPTWPLQRGGSPQRRASTTLQAPGCSGRHRRRVRGASTPLLGDRCHPTMAWPRSQHPKQSHRILNGMLVGSCLGLGGQAMPM